MMNVCLHLYMYKCITCMPDKMDPGTYIRTHKDAHAEYGYAEHEEGFHE